MRQALGKRLALFNLAGWSLSVAAALGQAAKEQFAKAQNLIARLDRLEAHANQIRVPLTFTHMIYTLRVHIRPVREQLEKQMASVPRPA